MASFLWLIPPEGGIALSSELPRRLIIPHAQASGLQYRIKGETIWIVDNSEGWLLAKVVVSQTTEFIEGINKGDFLVHLDYSQSIRVGARKLDVRESVQSYARGLNELEEELHFSWLESVLSLVETRFVPPKVDSLKVPFEHQVQGITIGLENTTMAFLIQRMSVDEVWRSEKKTSYGPYALFAITLLKSCGLSVDEAQEEFLNQIDPISQLERIPGADINTSKGTRVDLFFSEIDSSLVTYRQFADRGSIHDKKSAISMLNDAERRHQHVLKWLSEYIASMDLIPQQSNSVDLLVNKGRATLLCEIKTIRDANLEGQIAKGIFQVIKYELAMAGRFGEVTTVLIVEGRTTQDELIQANRVAERIGVELIWVGDSTTDGLHIHQFHSLLKNQFGC